MTQEVNTMNQPIRAETMKTGKYLTFSLEKEEYGISILKVKEIIGMMPIVSVPQSPAFIKGVVNLRGKVIPIMDLRAKFEMPSIPPTERTCIIVVEIDSTASTTMLIGIVVDAVSEVLNIKEEEIEPPPEFGTRLKHDYILGMAKRDGRVMILLNIDKILSSDEVVEIEQTSNNQL
ncbi:MAG: chemotaxis protein CheW [Desulfobulbaceae bacterium]|nr:MAG: chemotaxis protein CheW [Desulfobulbaceae bacterium]